MTTETRVLVLGAAGMLGHKLVEILSRRFHVTASLRGSAPPDGEAARYAFAEAHLLFGVDVASDEALANAFAVARPDIVINSVGIIKQLKEATDPLQSIAINALLPHRLARLCAQSETPARLIHFSTDCVFSGRRGPYGEADHPDAEDLYGRSKLLGEVAGPRCLTLRSSIIGRELRGGSGLVEWFVAQRGKRVKGYANALYTGITTAVMADLVAQVIRDFPELEGVWQVAAEPIDKFHLLQLIDRQLGLGIAIERDEDFHCDRRLDGARFRERTGIPLPDWDAMIAGLAAESPRYEMRS